jgi:hypothetical protein
MTLSSHQKCRPSGRASKGAIPMSISELGKKTISELSIAVFELAGLGISLPADLVNTSKYLQQNNDEQKSSAVKTSDFSKKDASLHTITMN